MAMPAEMAMLAEMAALAEHRTSQRTQTSRHPGQPIAMSEKSSNFALAFGTWVAMADTAPLNRRATKASALPIRAKLSGGPNGDASHAHRTFIALPSHTRARVAAKSLAGGPRPKAVPDALRAFQGPEGGLGRR